MTRRELQQALKSFKEQGLTAIKLTAKTEELQAEFDRVGSCPIGFTPIPEPEPFVAEVPETEDETLEAAMEPIKQALLARCEGANDEARMQDVIDKAGLWEELETAWQIIPGYSDFESIFQGNAAMGMFAELMMSESEHANYVRICKEAQRIEQEFTRRALEKLVSQ
ncbi:MAG: hypothetical protein HC836_34365 [Richelia sp. RM2_1_2]|nr:hypothetical protein [Richelia sp. RM2_1_2]